MANIYQIYFWFFGCYICIGVAIVRLLDQWQSPLERDQAAFIFLSGESVIYQIYLYSEMAVGQRHCMSHGSVVGDRVALFSWVSGRLFFISSTCNLGWLSGVAIGSGEDKDWRTWLALLSSARRLMFFRSTCNLGIAVRCSHSLSVGPVAVTTSKGQSSLIFLSGESVVYLKLCTYLCTPRSDFF
jgi:hypothetical protein